MYLFIINFFFLQTDTTNTELKPVFGSSICKIESVFTEDNIVSSRCKRKQSYKALENTCSYPTIGSYPTYLEVLGFHSLHG